MHFFPKKVRKSSKTLSSVLLKRFAQRKINPLVQKISSSEWDLLGQLANKDQLKALLKLVEGVYHQKLEQLVHKKDKLVPYQEGKLDGSLETLEIIFGALITQGKKVVDKANKTNDKILREETDPLKILAKLGL